MPRSADEESLEDVCPPSPADAAGGTAGMSRRNVERRAKRYPGDREEARGEDLSSGEGALVSWMSANWSGSRDTSAGSAGSLARLTGAGSSAGVSSTSGSRVRRAKKAVIHKMKGAAVLGRKRHCKDDGLADGYPAQMTIEMVERSYDSATGLMGEDAGERDDSDELNLLHGGMGAIWRRQRKMVLDFQTPGGGERAARESDFAFDRTRLRTNDHEGDYPVTATLLDQLEILE